MRKYLPTFLIAFILLGILLPTAVLIQSPRAEVWIIGKPTITGRPQPSQTIPWGIERIHAPDAWKNSTGVGVQIAVLDTGVDRDHVDLYVNIEWGISVVGDTESTAEKDWTDRNGHGTHVIGTIAAMYNDIGVVGVAYNISIYAIKVLNNAGFGTWEDAAEGVYWAMKGPDGIIGTEDDAEVISMSFGGFGYSQIFHDAIKAAYDQGIVLVAAAGNEGDDGVTYPAKFEEVIAVAAIDEYDNVPTWSSKGPEVELAAPGVDILSTVPNDRYDTYSGTSMAAPHVAGTVGLMISKILAEGRNYTVEYIRDILHTTADDIGPSDFDESSGYGVVRADKAVAQA